MKGVRQTAGGVLTRDLRQRCEATHLICDGCARCACNVDASGRVSTDRYGLTLCPDCRHDAGLET